MCDEQQPPPALILRKVEAVHGLLLGSFQLCCHLAVSFPLPPQYTNTLLAADELLICGWMGDTFMWELLAELDHSDQGLPAGSRVTLFNSHPWTRQHLGGWQRRGVSGLLTSP